MLSREHLVLNREAGIAAELIASGVAALGRANYAQPASYALAFFNLSIGFERTAKLIYIADFCIDNNGTFPSDDKLKHDLGHDLTKALRHVESVSTIRRRNTEYWERPSTAIHNGIVETLSEFATKTRYYNLALVTGGSSADRGDPVANWHRRVGLPVLTKHCTPKERQRIDARAHAVAGVLGQHAIVRHTSEAGDAILSMYDASRRAGESRVIQKWAPFYVLQLVRWMAFLVDDLSRTGAYEAQIDALLGLNEYYAMYLNDDAFLKSRRTWSLLR